MSDMINPNTTLGTAIEHSAVQPLDNIIADKVAAMVAQRDASRNKISNNQPTATGEPVEAKTVTPVAPDNVEDIVEPEGSNTYDEDSSSTDEPVAPDDVSVSEGEADSTADELIDFLEFTESNPKAKFKFMRNGKEVVIDAKKAAAILGQGGAIHEEARELKIQKAEFEEYLQDRKAYTEGLALAMEFTVEPRLRQARDEIKKVQGYQQVFQHELTKTQDYAERASIEAAIEQNNDYIRQQSQLINDLKPKVEEFKEQRKRDVADYLESNRKQFKDKELKNAYVYNEVREKVAKDWEGAKRQLVPGIDNIDLISSDEHILSLLRDGLKYRDRPKGISAGSSVATLTGKPRSPQAVNKESKDDISKLREQANKGDARASQNLLERRMAEIRASRRK